MTISTGKMPCPESNTRRDYHVPNCVADSVSSRGVQARNSKTGKAYLWAQLVRFGFWGTLFLLGVSYDVRAVALLQPANIVGGDSQDADRSSTSLRISIDGQTKEQIYGLGNIPVPYLGMSPHVLPNSHTTVEPANIVTIARVSRPSANFVVAANRKFFNVPLNSHSGMVSSCQFEDSATILCPLVERGFLTLQSGDFSLQSGNNLESCSIQHVGRGPLSLGRARNDVVNIKSVISTVRHAFGGPEESSGLPYLASLFRNFTREEAIRSNDYIATGDDQHRLSSRTQRGGNEEPEAQQQGGWRYMRFWQTGTHESETDSQTGEEILVLGGEDIDVSCDGKSWFHFGGPHCHTKAMKMPAVIPRCPTHDPSNPLPSQE